MYIEGAESLQESSLKCHLPTEVFELRPTFPMARHESDREDLFAEATAFNQRAELAVGGHAEWIVFGNRADGAWSVCFEGDPVYHFDRHGRLKRAFANGRLFRTQGDTLAELTRERTVDATVLRRRDLQSLDCDHFLAALQARFARLLSAIKTGDVRVLRRQPADFDVLQEMATLLKATLAADRSDFLAPRFRGKR